MKRDLLKLQTFLKKHPNDYEELLTQKPYCLKIKHDGKLVLFKYDQTESNFAERIVYESRGIILEEGTWKVVRLAFYKFFNYGERYAAVIDWSTSWATEKIDGSLISVFWYDGSWRIATSGCINAFDATLNVYDLEGNLHKSALSFGEIFEKVIPLSVFDEYDFNKNYCYTFELVSPESQVIIKYDEPELFILSVRDMETLEELSYPEEYIPRALRTKISKPTKWYHTNADFCCLAQFKELVANMGDNHEGIVVCDGNFNRVKMKTTEYLTRHYYKCNGINLDRLANIAIQNEDSEFLSYFPEYDKSLLKIHAYIDLLKDTAKECDETYTLEFIMPNVDTSDMDPREKRKLFAKWVMEHHGNDPYRKGLLFKGYDHKAVETLNNWGQNQWLDFVKYAIEHPKEWIPKFEEQGE
jgi:hypothetical protein